jgi:gliding motility-associated-like protein
MGCYLRKTLAILLFLLPPVFGFSQFFLNGDAVQLNDSCYQLTSEQYNQVGSIWNPDKIDLSESFEVLLQLYFGCENDQGADGIVFGFQPVSTSIGTNGGGIGFEGVNPSIGIEFDTWQNTNRADPAYDHIAIISSGNNDHSSSSNLAGPVQARAGFTNIEDCRFHDVRVSWDAVQKELVVSFDCEERLSFQGDIVNNYLGGDPLVYWGFTSATGGAFNIHQVCLKYTTFLDKQPDLVLCPGGQVPLQVRGGVSYEWNPAEGLSNPFIANPIASPNQTTTYLAAITDDCDFTFYNEVTVEVSGDSVFFDLGPDTALCKGQEIILDASTPNAEFQWSNGEGGPTIQTPGPGLFSVTVTRTDTFCISVDQVEIRNTSSPVLDLGPDTALCPGQLLVLESSFQPAQYEWNTGETGPLLIVSEPGTYVLQARNHCGWERDQIRVETQPCDELFFPNIFSPNGDGVNDKWYPFNKGDVREIQRLAIFSRWGELVFEKRSFPPNDPSFGWDGKYKNQPLPPGLFVWQSQLIDSNGQAFFLSGTIQLIR